MKVCIQRVSKASVVVDGETVGKIDKGLLVLFGAVKGDEKGTCKKMASKTVNLRIFEDENGKMSNSVKDIDGEVLAVSQFTLAALTKKGLRPDFGEAMEPALANEYFEYFKECCSLELGKKVESGIFAAHMEVSLVNDGPVTINIDM